MVSREASIEPSRIKLRWAQAHFETLDHKVRSFLNTKPYGILSKRDPESGAVMFWAEALDTPPVEWSLIVGDCAHALRTALDYLVWQLVLRNDGTPNTGNEFPIFPDPDWYARHAAKDLAGMAEEPATLVEELQPFRRRYDWTPDLMLIHDLDRYDKHRFLQITSNVLERFTVRTATSNCVAYPEYHQTSGPFEHEAKLATIRPSHIGPDARMEVYPEASFDIAFDEEGVLAGALVIATLGRVLRAVRRTLLEFERFF